VTNIENNVWSSPYLKDWPVAGLPDLSDRDKEVILNHVRESFPLEQNVTDQNDPPLWSFTVWPRTIISINDVGGLVRNESAFNSKVVIENITYDLNGDLLRVTRNLPPSRVYSSIEFTWFAFGNTSYNASNIEARGKCLPSDEYVWGFSSLMLFTFCMITTAVALILITLHYDAYFNSATDRYKLSISPYRDVLDLAEELREHYGSAETAEMSAKELDRAMREDPVATRLETETLHRSRRAMWKQAKTSKMFFTRGHTWRRSKVAESQAATDAEKSLMSVGFDASLHSEMEMAILPARVASRSAIGT
jgi:hypothetical protein